MRPPSLCHTVRLARESPPYQPWDCEQRQSLMYRKMADGDRAVDLFSLFTSLGLLQGVPLIFQNPAFLLASFLEKDVSVNSCEPFQIRPGNFQY